MTNILSEEESDELLQLIRARFQEDNHHTKETGWDQLEKAILKQGSKLWSLAEMERTGGEPRFFEADKKTGELLFIDCSAESPKGRRSLCYDGPALLSRKENKPVSSAVEMAADMGVELLDELIYRQLHSRFTVDQKTSSWILTAEKIRKMGGALFCDYRYGTIFVYHNGAESYYAARGFRGVLRV